MNNPEMEARLIASMLFAPENVTQAVALGVCAEVWTEKEHEEIFGAIMFTVAKVPPTTALDAVWQAWTGMSGDPQGVKMRKLVAISREAATSTNTESLSLAVVGLWKQRRLCRHLSEGLEAAKAPAASWEAVLEAASPSLKRIEAINSMSKPVTLRDLAEAAKRDYMEPDLRRQVSTGWAAWDRIATAPRAGQMIVAAGYTGSGKSAFAIQIADYIASNHGPVVVFSFEMTAEEIIGRIAKQRAGRFAERDAIAKQYDAIADMKTLTIYDASTCPNIVQLEGLCRAAALGQLGLSAIVVDYIQQVQADPNTLKGQPNREQVVASIARRLKMLALTLKVPLFALSQINNESIKDDRMPRLSDVRESMAIANDADRVWFLYADKTEMPDAAFDGGASEQTMILLQEKCRGGPGHVATRLKFHKPSFTFKP